MPESSAIIDGFDVTKLSIHYDHRTMCKFETDSEAGYTRTSGKIMEFFRRATEARPGKLLSLPAPSDQTDFRSLLVSENEQRMLD